MWHHPTMIIPSKLVAREALRIFRELAKTLSENFNIDIKFNLIFLKVLYYMLNSIKADISAQSSALTLLILCPLLFWPCKKLTIKEEPPIAVNTEIINPPMITWLKKKANWERLTENNDLVSDVSEKLEPG